MPQDIYFGDDVDSATFEQILDMDEEGDKEFSESIVLGFLSQAQETFDSMDKALEEKNLEELSRLGHFLKGSSATLGFTKVKDQCEKIQNYGHKKDATGEIDQPDEKICLDGIDESLGEAKRAYANVKKLMLEYYAAPTQ